MKNNRLKMAKFYCLMMIIGLLSIPQLSNAQITNPGFETGDLSTWNSFPGTSISSGMVILNWTVNPADYFMASLTPEGISESSAESYLGLPYGSLASFNATFNSTTDFAVITKQIYLGANESITVYWNYISRDYTPYNDGAIATLVGPSYQQIQLLAVTANANGNSTAVVTGSYGSTGWRTATFTSGAAGTYTFGYSVFNWGDTAVDPTAALDDATGGTFAPGEPVVTTAAITSIGSSTAVSGGNVISGIGVTARGVCWNSTGLPTLSDSFTMDGSGTGIFTSNLSGLQVGTTYSVRAYATNSAATVYGGEVSFVITDNIAPEVTCPSSITVVADAGLCSAVVNFSASVTDNYDSNPSVIYSHSSGSSFGVGTTLVTVIASDASNNVSSCSFDVIVEDDIDPSIFCQDISVCADDAVGKTLVYDVPLADDFCGIAQVTLIAGLQSGSVFPVGSSTVTYEAVDVNENTSQCSFVVTIFGLPSVEAGNCQTRYLGYEALDIGNYLVATGSAGTPGYSYSWSPTGSITSFMNETVIVFPFVGTTYTVLITDANGCVASDEVYVDVVDVVSVCSTSKNQKVQVCHIPPGNTANSNEICVSTNAVGAHLAHGDHLGYCDNPCQEDLNPSKNTNPVMATDHSHSLMDVYPNPTGGDFTIKYMLEYDSEVEIKLLDVTGKLITILYFNESGFGNEFMEFPVSKDLPSGLYTIQLRTEHELINQKIVISE